MPRLPTSLLLKARALNPLLLPLLKTCRDLPSAANELRWLTEHASKCVASQQVRWTSHERRRSVQRLLQHLCAERARGKPLQYLVGTTFFGDLELLCRPGVLIPRPETADMVMELAKRLGAAAQRGGLPRTLRILDLCTGSGCIALLLHSQLRKIAKRYRPASSILGVDYSEEAVQTAKRNRLRLPFPTSGIWDSETGPSRLAFARADITATVSTRRVLSLQDLLDTRPGWWGCEIVVCNPPYISPEVFMTTAVEKSVRAFEPRAALVPPPTKPSMDDDDVPHGLDMAADLFYPRTLSIAHRLRAKVVLMEVGGREQAERVANEVRRLELWDGVEVWRDGVSLGNPSAEGEERAVVCWKGDGASWLAKTR